MKSLIKDFLQGKWLGHPLHPIFVHLPTALWPTALLFDILAHLGVGGKAILYTSFYAILVGLLAALLAILTGLADWFDIRRNNPAWKIGWYHLLLNVLIVLLWIINLGLRMDLETGLNFVPAEVISIPAAPLALSVLGTLLLFVSGYLGGMMVYDYGIGVARLSKKEWRQIAESGGARVPPE